LAPELLMANVVSKVQLFAVQANDCTSQGDDFPKASLRKSKMALLEE
jgi:hypothetical protein